MSQENVEIVRRVFAAFNARDVEELVRLFDPECEFQPFRAQLEGQIYRGHEGMRRFASDMEEDWDTYLIDPTEFRAREDRVGVAGHITAVAPGPRVIIESRAGFVFDLREGRILRVVSHSDPAVALDAVWLPD
jgi:ketosteroid isomerase-like protein